MMNGSNKESRLVEIICAKILAPIIRTKFDQLCCGCKKHEQECLMLTEFEKWRMYGFEILVENKNTICLEVMNVFEILNIHFGNRFAEQLSDMEKSADFELMELLFRLCERNQPLVKVLSDFSCWDSQTDPLADFALCYFSLPPSFKYFVKGTDETFVSHKRDHKKAYRGYIKHSLQQHFDKL